jgi:type II secretory pathway pseudopilin PulG
VAAFSLIELVFVLGLAATLGAFAIPLSLASLDDVRAAGAARYVSARLQQARMEAIVRGSATALRISPARGAYEWGVYVDGNRNGVRSTDIQRGTDRAIAPSVRLVDQFPGVDFGAMPGLPAVDVSGPPPGTDPIRLGSSDMAVFTPLGTATTGSLYIHGRRSTQYVVRIFGETGKTRVLKFNARSRQWIALQDG